MHVRHELLPGDFSRHYASPCGLTNAVHEKIFCLIFLLETIEASFVRNGEVNKQIVQQHVPKGVILM